MPKTFGQWIGIVVTSIVVLGCDADVAYAMPLGMLAGAVATFFVTMADGYEKAALANRRAPVASRR